MDGKTVRNMYSADNNKEHCIVNFVGYIKYTLAMHASINVKLKKKLRLRLQV